MESDAYQWRFPGQGGIQMKCQYCEKPATFHITELTDPSGPSVMHLCEEHARSFLQKDNDSPAASIAGALAKQLDLGQTKAELAELDQKECPVCGISFFEFRNTGRLGCPHDYSHFKTDLAPLLTNIHESLEHHGKTPSRATATVDIHAQMIGLRREMEDAIEHEDYERASEIRDQLKAIEQQGIQAGEDSGQEHDDADAGEGEPSS